MVPHPARRRGTFLWAWPASAAAKAAPKMTSDVCAEVGGKKVCSGGETWVHFLSHAPFLPLMYISFVGFVQWSDPVLCFTVSLNKFSMSCSYEMWWCLIFLEESDDLGSVCLKLLAVCFLFTGQSSAHSLPLLKCQDLTQIQPRGWYLRIQICLCETATAF